MTSDNTDNWTAALAELGDVAGQDVLRLRPDEEIVVGFVGSARPFKRHYTGTTYEPCLGDKCPFDHERDAPQTRVIVDLFLFATGQALVFESTPTLFQELVRLRATHPIEQWAFRLGREGTGLETRYRVEPHRELTAEQIAAIAAAPRHDLAARVEAEKARALKKLEEAVVDDVKHDPSEYNWDLGDADDAKVPGI